MGAPAARVHELSRAWVRRGHKVTVLTAFPHHPTGIIPEGYRGRRMMRESVDGIEVLRTWVYATPNKGFAKRLISYISFMCSALVLGLPWARRRRFDAVVATSPQFFVAVAGWLIATGLRARLYSRCETSGRRPSKRWGPSRTERSSAPSKRSR